MANYTMEVKKICETLSGISGGFNNVNEIIDKSWNLIFSTSAVIYDEDFTEKICKKILKNYYLREICCETFGRWALYMNNKFENIAPFYSELVSSTKLQFDPMINTDITETGNTNENKSSTLNSDVTKEGSTINNGNTHAENVHNDENLHSDTPQSELEYVETGRYITDADFKQGGFTNNATSNDNTTTTSSDNTKTNTSAIGNINNSVTKKGNNGENSSEMLLKYRKTILNIEQMIVDEFKDCFFIIY